MSATLQTTLDDILNLSSLIKFFVVFISLSLTIIPNCPINNRPWLVLILTRRPTCDKPLSETTMAKLHALLCVYDLKYTCQYASIIARCWGVRKSSSWQTKILLCCMINTITFVNWLVHTFRFDKIWTWYAICYMAIHIKKYRDLCLFIVSCIFMGIVQYTKNKVSWHLKAPTIHTFVSRCRYYYVPVIIMLNTAYILGTNW